MEIKVIEDLHLEKSVLASALTSEQALYEVSTMLTVDSFYNLDCKTLFLELEPLPRKGQHADIMMITAKLGDGWVAKLTELVSNVATSTTVKRHCEELKNIEIAREVSKRAYNVFARANGVKDYAEYYNWGIEQFTTIGDGKYNASSLDHISDHIPEALNELKDVLSGKIKGLKTGIRDIDESSGGFRGGEYVVIAGRPSQGKSSLGLSVIKNMALDGARVGLFSLEMTASQNVFKLTSLMSGVGNDGARELPYGVFRGTVPAKRSYLDSFQSGCDKLSKSSVYINTNSYTSITDLENELRSFCNRNSLDAFVLDYIGLVGDSLDSNKKNHEKVAGISSRIRSLIKSLNVVGIVLVQLGRDAHNKKPSMANLADSTQIERDAHFVYLIHQPDVADKTKKVIICDKGRDGGEGDYPTNFCTQTTEFVSMDKQEGEDYMLSLRDSSGASVSFEKVSF